MRDLPLVTYIGPSTEEPNRGEKWRAWVESYFERVSEANGPAPTKGALRTFGDFDYWCEAIAVGLALLSVNSRTNPGAHRACHVRWEIASPELASAFMLARQASLEEID